MKLDRKTSQREKENKQQDLYSAQELAQPTSAKAIKRCRVFKRCNARHKFLINRIVTLWNSLPNSVIEAETLNKFKARLDEWFQNEWKLLKPTRAKCMALV
ncbi:hypothetical protein BpHYR1_024478 [Brachionus plicatilis]|uniref:RNA-directed DNA polymerase from mobile element jockey-like n=1 Tax=Brachionus plicatilis TaxID=10195 RepID=A0A3M7SDU3_BRAPC|nr:hypothetical protein BpHYR1_024478 [Brachionus plicatilis]